MDISTAVPVLLFPIKRLSGSFIINGVGVGVGLGVGDDEGVAVPVVTSIVLAWY